MSEPSETLTKEEIAQIAEKDDFHIAPFREDGVTYGTPTWIWCVTVDDNLYVRAFYGTKSRWYQAAIRQKIGKIEAAGMVKKVRFEAVTGGLNDRIDEAYRKKYSGSLYLNSMISDRARSATVKIIPFQQLRLIDKRKRSSFKFHKKIPEPLPVSGFTLLRLL